MVGREVHFMLPAGWWTTAGLVLSLVGVVLIFRYGMPYRVRTRGQPIRVAISSDPRAATLECGFRRRRTAVPIEGGQYFRSIADSIPMIADRALPSTAARGHGV